MILFLLISISIIFAFLSVSLYYNYKLGVIIINTQEQIEESLDILDEKYVKMNEITQIPVFFDSVEVRQVIKEISDCRDSILLIANKLTYDSSDNNAEEDNETKKNSNP